MIRSTSNYGIARVGFTLRGASGILGIFATSSCLMQVKGKNQVLSTERGDPGTVPFSKYIHKKIRRRPVVATSEQKPLISSESYCTFKLVSKNLN